MSRTLPFRKVYGPAIVLAVITLYGLFSALLGDGLWDELSWIALSIPLAVIVWKFSRSRHTQQLDPSATGNEAAKGN